MTDLSLFLSFGIFLILLYKYGIKKSFIYIDQYKDNISNCISALEAEQKNLEEKAQGYQKKIEAQQEEWHRMLASAHTKANERAQELKDRLNIYIETRHHQNAQITARLKEERQQDIMRLVVDHTLNKARLTFDTASIEDARTKDLINFLNDAA